MLIKWTELIGIINNHDVVLPMCYWASAGPTDQKHFLPFSIFPGVHHMYLHEPCLSVPIETAPSLTEQSMSLCVFYMRACLCSYIHAYVSAYVSSFTNMPFSSTGWKACRLDVMYEKGWSRSLCVLGDAARMSPRGKTYQGVQVGGWVFPFGRSVGGTPTLCHSSLLHIQYSVRKHKHMHRQLFLDTQSRTAKNILHIIMSHTHM